MKIIKYKMPVRAGDLLLVTDVEMGWSEVNEAIAKAEAVDGVYTIEDDGQPDPEPTPEDRIAELEEALELLLTGVTE